MGDAIGLSVGATRFAGVCLRRSALTRPATPGLVDRVGDPVGVLGPDGRMHRADVLVSRTLHDLLRTVTGGRPARRPTVAYPAHWRKAQVDALRTALGLPVISDAVAAIAALQSAPGVPARGVLALCDFGGTGINITLLDATAGYAPLGPTVRHLDLCGDLIDQALLRHLVATLPKRDTAQGSGTSALGPLHRLRAQCRGAKERLSAAAVTALTAELPGFRGDVRLTRAELDDVIREPLSDFVRVLYETLGRAGIHPRDLVAVASTGGGARIPLVTTTLSEHFRVPVITTPRPELTAAEGAALRASWGPATVAAPTAAIRPLAWSEAHDVPPIVPAEAPAHACSARPQLEFASPDEPPATRGLPWYRRASTRVGIAAIVLGLLATTAAVAYGTAGKTVSSTSRTVYVSPAPATSETPPIAGLRNQPHNP